MDQAKRGDGGARRNTPGKKNAGRIAHRVLLVLATLLCIGILTVVIFFKIFMTYVNTTLVPTLDVTVEELTMSEASTILYLDKTTSEWKKLDTLHVTGGNRKVIEYGDLPQDLINAVVAIEDHRFWEHAGVDWKGTAAAFIKTFTSGSTRGGSTITQQMLRNVTEDTEVTVKRKIREIFRALEFEKSNSKEDILTLYLNYVYFGSGCNGVQTASEKYFGKDVSQLTLAESAAIIGITNNPSLYDPFLTSKFVQEDGTVKTPRDFNKERQIIILNRMQELGIIDAATCEAAKAEPLLFTDTPEYAALHAEETGEPEEAAATGEAYSWFVDTVIDESIALIREAKGCSEEVATNLLFSAGYQIYTTMDMDVQKVVDEVYGDPANFNYPSSKGTPLDSAIAITDPYTGDILAMAGGVGEKLYSRSLNLATKPRPCGSAIKPLSVYAPAIDNNVITPASVLDDYPVRLNDQGTAGYPKNSNNKYRGYLTISYGIQWSVNTIAARTLQKLSYDTSYYFMNQKLGFHLVSADRDLGPLSMGGLTYGVTAVEMAAAYGTFANNGVYSYPRTVSKIVANDGVEVVADNPSRSQVAMKETTAYLMNTMLRSVVTGGTGTSASFSGMTIAGKTGTTSNNFDRYFVGYTPYYSAAVWVGYSESNEKINAGSKNPAALAWKMVMEQIHEGLEKKSFPEKPSGIVTVSVCQDCGMLATDLCSADERGSRVVTLEVQESAAPKASCTCHVQAKVCTDPETGERHLAGEHCPESTCATVVLIKGRAYLEIPGAESVTNADGTVTQSAGTLITAEDDAYTLSYLEYKGSCPLHDEGFVDPGEDPVPGDPDWEWPEWLWPDPDDEPDEPEDPTIDPTPDPEPNPEPQEPAEPALPTEP